MANLTKEYRKKYYEEHKDKIKSQLKTYGKKYPEKGRDRCKKFAKTPKGRFATYKGGAKVRGLIFDISIKEFIIIISSKCYYCGEDGYEIDRLDSAIGYIKGNIVPACSTCNLMKQSMGEQEFIDKCKQITNTWKRSAIVTW